MCIDDGQTRAMAQTLVDRGVSLDRLDSVILTLVECRYRSAEIEPRLERAIERAREIGLKPLAASWVAMCQRVERDLAA